ncbi:hypothetical protein G5C60_03440 [Streptomyces sp. HC44]|uniref:Uncharacterized protein n=1 Tax=Streptomyces scabichelini TaxID=2711217 RepID=A0A6G4UYB0_9ACTN|nr:hypothetical protein [Streptomyces scabichelini]NGO06741.1 hypothetical protein [Streptomyces scabichelini]
MTPSPTKFGVIPMDAIGASHAIEILEEHAIVPKDERTRTALFAALSMLRLLALGGDHAESG